MFFHRFWKHVGRVRGRFWETRILDFFTFFDSKRCSKISRFLTSNFERFFTIWAQFWEVLGVPAPPKIHEKSSKIPKKWILGGVLDTSFVEGGFWKGYGRILGGFLVDFWMENQLCSTQASPSGEVE